METKLCLLETKRNKIIETLKSRSLKNTQNEIKANLILENMNLKQGNLNQIHQNLELKGDIILQLDSLNKKSTLANNAKSCFEGIIKFSFTLDSILSNYKISDFNDLLDLKQYILKLDAQDNLLKYLDSKSLLAYSTIKSKLQVDLSNALKSTNYPKAESNTIYPALESAITNLLKLY